MKRPFHFIMAVLMLTTVSSECQASPLQDKKAVTFVVDEQLPAPKEQLRRYPADVIVKAMKASAQLPSDDGTQVVALSFENDSLVYHGADVMFDLLRTAYADHRPVVLSPDAIWLTICQGFSRYVNAHAEMLRPLLVSHEAQMDLTVVSQQDLLGKNVNWSKLMQDFTQRIGQHAKGNLAQTITANFTTTTVTEQIASQVTLMDMFKQYFNYKVMHIVCGIPSITLTGSADDWRLVASKTKQLRICQGLNSWIDRLMPILQEFVAAANGKANQTFWQNIVRKKRVNELRGGGCSQEKSTMLDGWFLTLFPDSAGMVKDSVRWDYRDMPTEMVRVGFKYKKITPRGDVLSETPMELWAGFVGMDSDPYTQALTPRIGWLVRTSNEDEELVHKFYMADRHYGGIKLTGITEVPLALTQIEHIKRLTLEFEGGKVVLPDWFTKLQIDELVIKGQMTEGEADDLNRQMPKTIIDVVY